MAELIRLNATHALAVVNPAGVPQEGDDVPSAHLSLDADGNLRTSGVAVIGGSVEISNDVGNPVPVSGTVEITNDVGNAIPVSAASLPLPTGAATAALQTQPGVDIGDVTVNNGAGAAAVNIQDGGNSITVDGSVTANAGTNLNTSALALEATQLAQSTLVGDVIEAAPATDTASSGLNGRLQRIAQRLTSLLALLPTSLGQKTSANSLAVVIASDQSAVPVSTSIPATADIAGVNRTTTGTLYTVPAGRTFQGSLSLACSISVAGSTNPSISIAGADIAPPAGTIFQIVNTGLALAVATSANTLNDVYIYGGSAGCVVTFNAGADGSSSGQIAGRLL